MSLFFLFVIAVFLFYKYIKYRQSHWKRLDVPQAEPTFFVGNYLQNWKGTEHMAEVYDKLYRRYKGNDRVVGIYQLLKPELFITDPSLVKEVGVKNFSSFYDTSFATMINPEKDGLLARNPFFLSGQEWKEKRAEITPAFSPARVKAMFPLIDEICAKIVEYLGNNQEQSIEARDLCSRFTCDVVSNCIFAADAESFVQKEPKIRKMATSILVGDGSSQIKFLIALAAPSIFKILGLSFVSKEVEKFFTDMTAQTLQTRQKTGIKRQDYFDYLIQMQAKKKVSDLELAANAITFFIDGLDTSSTGIAMTLYELARHKDLQTQLRCELEQVNSYEELSDNEYLDCVLNEALRLHPPAPFMARECTTPIEMNFLAKDKKHHMKKGDSITIPIWSIHHDEKVYEDPESFKPERFMNGGLKRYRDEGVYLTFGLGPRTCLGQKFALLQSKACIAAIVKNFEIDLDTNKTQTPLKLNPTDFLTYHQGGVWLKYKKIVR